MGEKFLLVDYGVSDSIDTAYTLFSSQAYIDRLLLCMKNSSQK